MKAQFRQRFWSSLGLISLSIAGNPVSLALGLGVVATLATPTYSNAAVLTGWRFNANNSELEVTVPDGVTPRYFLLAQPARIVLDLPNTTVGAVPALQAYPGQVRQIRVGEFQPGLTRIVIELAPDAVLASPQVELRQLGQGRWGLRPLFSGGNAGDSSIAAQPNPSSAPTPTLAAPQAIEPSSLEPSSAAELSPESVRDPIQVQPPAVAAAPQPVPTSAPQTTLLPPLEPDATEIPVEIPEAAIAPETRTPEARTPEARPTPVTPQLPTVAALRVAPEPYDPQLPTTLPPATPTRDRPVTVQVPALGSASVNRPVPAVSAQPTPVQLPAPPTTPAQPPVMPPVESSRSASSPPAIVPPVMAPPVSRTPIIPASPTPVAVAPNPAVLLPSGTVLRLRYPRGQVLELEAGSPWQEVLVLNQAVSDRAGNIIAPEGSPVIGRFETDQTGSRFVAQAITLGGRNVRLTAQSSRLEGDRQVTENQLVRNSALGGLALTVLGAFTGVGAIAGVVAGAAAGAATTYLTAPQPTTIQPNQIVEVRLTEDLSRSQ